MRRKLTWIVIALVVIVGAITFMLFMRGDEPSPTATAPVAVLSSPQQVDIHLEIKIPKGSESENPNHQEIDGEGIFDPITGESDLTYDFNDLNNAGDLLGHFDEMQVLSSDGSIYLDVFIDGPPWVRVTPEDVGDGDIRRLRDILLTHPLTLTSYLDVAANEEETSGATVNISSESLIASADPYVAAVGTFLEERESDMIKVELMSGDQGPELIVVTFAYAAQEDTKENIEVVVTYELVPASAPTFEFPSEDDVREFSDLFG